MSFFQNFKGALLSYIADSVSLSIVDVAPPGDIINVNEVCTFQARVNNGGDVTMTDVSLEIRGLNGTKVATSSGGRWESSIVVNNLTVPAGAIRDTSNLYFKAPDGERAPATTLVNVHVKDWKGSLDSLLVNSTREEPGVFGHYTSQVHPS